MRASLLAVLTLVLAACGSPEAGAAPASPTVGPGAPTAATAAPTVTPRYLTTPLTDVRTGERFTIAELAVGKQALVMGMAVW